MRLVLAVLVASTGCAQLFGIDETTGADANTTSASVQVQKVSIGSTVETMPLDMTNQMATFYDDAAGTLAPIPGVQSATDTFTAEAMSTPSVLFTVPDVQVPSRMLALPSLAQRTSYIEYEHPNAQEPLPSSAFDLDITLPSAYVTGESFSIQAVGAWMSKGLVAADLPAPDLGAMVINPPANIEYSAFGLMVGGNPRVRITMADTVLVTRYAASKLTGVFQSPVFDQTDGPDALSGTMIAVPATEMLMATIDPPGYATRFAAARPSVAGLPMSWRVNAAPGHSLGSDVGVRLINGTATAGNGVDIPPDTMIAGTFGNPFGSLAWEAVMTFVASSSRTYAYTENAVSVNVALSANLTTVTAPSATLDMTMPAGLPITVTANNLALVTDGQMLPLDLTQPVTIEATVDRPTNTAYQLVLTELGIDTSGTAPVLVRKVIVDLLTAGAPQFKLPPTLFTVGKTYYMTVRSYQGGFVGAPDGDVQALTLPFSTAALDSAVFTVGMP